MTITATGEAPATLHDKIYRTLCDYLMQGEFEPGQKISLRNLAEKLGTSTAPIREAMQRLAVIGAVNIEPKKAIQVPYLPADKYVDILEIRLFLEGRAIRKACDHMTEEELEELIEIDRALAKCIEEGRLKDTMKENQRFLFHMYRASRSETLQQMIEQLWLQVGPSINKHLISQFLKDKSFLGTVFSNHARIIQALKVRNPAQASAAKQDDLLMGAELIIEMLKVQDARLAASSIKKRAG